MRLLIFILSISIWQYSSAQYDSKTKAKLFEDQSLASFYDQDERIAFHLDKVIEELQSKTDEDHRIHPLRAHLICKLKEYMSKRRFPRNTLNLNLPYFIDEYGTACAVGHLMIESGHKDLALQIQKEHNNDFLPDIQTNGVENWAHEHGFSIEELAMIQPPIYPPPNILTGLGNGANGRVNHVERDSYNFRTYIAGEFTELDSSISCTTGFAYWDAGVFTCMDDKPEGIVHDNASYGSGSRILAGSFNVDGLLSPLIIFNYPDGPWEALNIPSREGATATNVWSQFDKTRVTLIPEDESEATEFWFRYEDDDDIEIWSHAITVIGAIHSSERLTVPTRQLIGGDFSSYINHSTGDTLPSGNLLSLTFSSEGGFEVESIESPFLPDDIRAIHQQNEHVLYVGGSCDSIYPNTYLTRLQNNVALPLLYEEEEMYIPNYTQINAIDEYLGGYLILGGNLGYYPAPGNHLMRYDLINGYYNPIASLDSTVLHIDNSFGTIHIAGLFTNNGFSNPLPHIARIGSPTSLIEYNDLEHSLSPNPATTEIEIAIDEPFDSMCQIRIYSLDGQEMKVNTLVEKNTLRLNVESLAPGVYIYDVTMGQNRAAGRFIKE